MQLQNNRAHFIATFPDSVFVAPCTEEGDVHYASRKWSVSLLTYRTAGL